MELSRVIHLSNRVVLPDQICAGGLDELIARPHSKNVPMIRVGSSKDPIDIDIADYRWQEHVHVEETTREDGKITYCTLDLPKVLFDDYYSGMANGFMWPLNHQRLDIAQQPYMSLGANGRMVFDRERFKREAKATRLVNDVFAQFIAGHERIAPTPQDTVVVHDYHFFGAGERLRANGVVCPTAFFLHTPAPSRDLYAQLHPDQQNYVRESLHALYAYDLVGVQADRDLRNIWSLASDGSHIPKNPVLYHPYEMTRTNLNGPAGWQKWSTAVGVMPVVGHYDLYAAQAVEAEAAAQQFLRDIHFPWPNIFTWGRLDYSKNGVNQVESIRVAIENEKYDLAAKEVCFLHHAALGREKVLAYQQEYENIGAAHEELVKKHGADGLQAKLFIEMVPRPILLAIARKARVGLITPLADGFNLTAAEYVAAQDKRNPGVLILGSNAGAANIITGEGALLVDATDPHEMASCIALAMQMPLRQRQTMHKKARQRLAEYNTNEGWQSKLITGARTWHLKSPHVKSLRPGRHAARADLRSGIRPS